VNVFERVYSIHFAVDSFFYESNQDFPASDDFDERTSSLSFPDDATTQHFSQLEGVKGKLIS